MKRIKIKAPIWHSHSIGVAEYKLSRDWGTEIEITYKTKNGELVYPDIYELTMREAIRYPRQVVRGGVVLRIIPINELRVKEER